MRPGGSPVLEGVWWHNANVIQCYAFLAAHQALKALTPFLETLWLTFFLNAKFRNN